MKAYDKDQWNRLAQDLENTVDGTCEQFRTLADETIEARAYAGAWSIKEVIGHLVDSAANNHQRFVRLQVTDNLAFPDYSQDNDAWVSIQNYQETPWHDLLLLWRHFNHHLAHIIRSVNPNCLAHVWQVNEKTAVGLGELMIDYLRHLKEHVQDIKDRLDQNA